MKNLVLTMFAVLAFVSCGHDNFETGNYQQAKQETFVADFNKTFGVTPEVYANHQWGMNTVPLIDADGNQISWSVTRGAETNSNQWGTNENNGKYKDVLKKDEIPAITADELNDVLRVFNQKGAESYTAKINWSTFFVQQVWKGTASYKAGNGGTVVGGNQMDWLCAYDPATNGDDHVNNFNNANGSVMLMMNSSTQRFGYKSSTDNGHVFYYFRMEEINGMYYVGFDFSAEGQNPNEQVQRDYIYNDWIVKIVPGQGYTIPHVDRVRVMCEDLGASNSDFDYNDIVFDIKFIKEGSTIKADILVQAAGGTLPLTIGGQEVHNLFAEDNNDQSISTTTMINTHANFGDHIDGLDPVPLIVTLPGSNYATAWDAINDLPIIVQNPNGQIVYLTINPGSPAEMIAVPAGTAWSDERVSIQSRYPAFATWISDPSVKWWE